MFLWKVHIRSLIPSYEKAIRKTLPYLERMKIRVVSTNIEKGYIIVETSEKEVVKIRKLREVWTVKKQKD